MKPTSFRVTRQRLQGDYAAILRHYKKTHSLKQIISFALMPSMWAVFLFRASHYFHSNGFKMTGRILYIVNLILTGADIAPSYDIDEGFLMYHPHGMKVAAKIGKNVTLTCNVILGGSGSDEDIGGGPGLPVIGNNVMLGARATVLGPVYIESGSFIGACKLVTKKTLKDSRAQSIPIEAVS